MINKIKVTNHIGESLTMELRFPEKSGFLVRSIEGLGPSKANINTTEMSGMDGSIFNSSSVQMRNIVLNLIFLEKPTIEKVRQDSYKYFPTKKQVRLEIETDLRTIEVYGYVESNEPGIFTKQGGTSISILCPSAYLSDINSGSTVFASITPLFEFPFSNESLVSPLIEFSSIISETEKSVLYTGDGSVGIVITIHAVGPASNVKIINSATLGYILVDSTKLVSLTGSDIVAGDFIEISTVRANKYAKLFRGSNEINILSTLAPDKEWFQLEKGDNIFAYTATSGLSNLEFKIDHEIAYEGL